MATPSIAARGKKTALALSAAALAACLAAAAGCAPRAADGPAAEAKTPVAVEVGWSPGADCAACHETEGATMAQVPCAAATDGSMACTTCHTDEAGLAKVHEGATTEDKTPSRLKKTEVDPAACESCHGSLESLAEKTAESTVLTDSNGKTVNPHAMPATERHEAVTCGSCHKMHAEDDVEATAPKACSSCHHTGVYECGTCHEKK